MDGTIIETESEKWMRQGMQHGMQQGQTKMLAEPGGKTGWIMKRSYRRSRKGSACLWKKQKPTAPYV